jgi:hypothetical protein
MFRACPKVIIRPDVKPKTYTEEVHLQQCFCDECESDVSTLLYIVLYTARQPQWA